MEEKFTDFTLDLFNIGSKVSLLRAQFAGRKEFKSELTRREKRMIGILKEKVIFLEDCQVVLEGNNIFIRIVPNVTIQDFIDLFPKSDINPKQFKDKKISENFNAYYIDCEKDPIFNKVLLFYFSTNQILIATPDFAGSNYHLSF